MCEIEIQKFGLFKCAKCNRVAERQKESSKMQCEQMYIGAGCNRGLYFNIGFE